MSTTANEWLLQRGHNNGGRCEKCWSEAGVLALSGEYESKTEAYHAVMQRHQDEAERATRGEL